MRPGLFLRWFEALCLGAGCCAVGWAAAPEGTYEWRDARELYPGIRHVRVNPDAPRPMNLNCLRIDARHPGLSFYTTPRCEPWEGNVSETVRQTTRQFMLEARTRGKPVVVAINADAWTPWLSATWNLPTRPNLKGLAVSDGTLVSPASGSPSLIVRKDGTMQMQTTDTATDLGGIHTAVSGFGFVLRDGEVVATRADLHPRTATGLSRDGRWVYWLTVDGRQPASGGASYAELGSWLRHFGAHTGINMDGGGSTTMAWWDPHREGPDKSALLNVPVGNGRSPGAGERCNGNHLGVCWAQPADAPRAGPSQASVPSRSQTEPNQ